MNFPTLATVLLVFWNAQDGLPQKVRWGRCPQIGVKQFFDIDRFLGTWYQYANFGTFFLVGEGRCVSTTFTNNYTSDRVDIHFKQIPSGPWYLPHISSIEGWVDFAYDGPLHTNTNDEAKLKVTFIDPVVNLTTLPYWVIDTDYDTWAIGYSCIDLKLAHTISGWILTREQVLEPLIKQKVEADVAVVLSKVNLKRSLFKITNQTHCNGN